MHNALALAVTLLLSFDSGPQALAQDKQDDLPARLRELDARVMEKAPENARMLSRDARSRIEEANRRSSQEWSGIKTREDWEKFRDARLQALRDSLGPEEAPPKDLKVRVTRTLEGGGHRIDNLVFESRPGLLVTANLYVPVPERPSMPGILICHSHHNPKTQSELQDMGVLWARLGCKVLVMDQIGHGERRQHPFVDAASFSGPFRAGRQDYFFRYVTGLQLYLAGESLIGWMAWDLMRGVDLLLASPGVDKAKILLLGAVAGGGDPAGVAAALDPRIAAAVPFNFGGPQPETVYPLPEDAETSFNYAGGGSWESTRNLRLSARDGFLPWVIVGSIAPRCLVYAHEFSWDGARDPVWKRLEKLYGFYGAPGNLAAATGRGLLRGQPPESTHCNNIGPEHRKDIHPAFKKWFDIAEPGKENAERRPAADLMCLAPDEKPMRVHELARERALARPRVAWSKVLGDTTPAADPRATAREAQRIGAVGVERAVLEVEAGIRVPLILLLPERKPDAKVPVVVAVAQGGKQEFLKKRSEEIAALLKGGAAVCLPDLRGTGETRPGDSRGRSSESTSLAATELMLGRTLVQLRVRDLRSVLRHLRGRPELDAKRLALWGDSFAPHNAPTRRFEMPLDAEGQPDLAEPLGGLAALFGAMHEEDVRAVHVRGGLSSFRSLLDSRFCFAPFDAVVPGALTAGDLAAAASALAPRPVRLEGLVDGHNRKVGAEELLRLYAPAGAAHLRVSVDEVSPAWMLECLK